MTIGPVNKDYIKQKVDAVREQIGRTVVVNTPAVTGCSICVPSGYLDTFSNTSTYIKCPVCRGSYWVETMEQTTLLARVHWVADEGMGVTPGGKFFVGEASMHVDPSYHSLMQETQAKGFITIDGQEMQIVRIDPRGLDINRLRIVLRSRGTKREEG